MIRIEKSGNLSIFGQDKTRDFENSGMSLPTYIQRVCREDGVDNVRLYIDGVEKNVLPSSLGGTIEVVRDVKSGL